MNELAKTLPGTLAIDALEDEKNITKGAVVQGVFTFLSRIAGMIRDVMVFHVFGATGTTDAFLVAFTIPNVLRQFFGEGAFSVAFVPVHLQTSEHEGPRAAREFFKDTFGFLALLLLIVTACGMYFSDALVHTFAHGFADSENQFSLTSRMTMWLFPYIFMISLVALFGAQLGAHRKFAAMSAAPIFLNLSMISAMILWARFFTPPIFVLVIGVLLGGVLQLILLTYSLKTAGLFAWPTLNVKTAAMKKFLKMLGPALFGVFVYQLNIIVLRQFASFLEDGQISYYYNADRLTQFATGVFAVSIATAALPELSRGIAKFGHESIFKTLKFTLVITSFVITPCALGLMVFAKPIVSVLYVHGAFSVEDAYMTAKTLVAFAPSLVAFSFSRPLIQAFYAQGNTKTPVVVGALTVLMNIVIGLYLIRYQVVGLALTLSVSSFMQYLILLTMFKKSCTKKFDSELLKPFCMHLGLSAIACGVGLWPQKWFVFEQGFTYGNAFGLILIATTSGIAYLFFGYYFKLQEARKLIDGMIRRIK